MPRALVTGSHPYLRPAVTALARTGFNVVTWETATAPPPPGSPFDCYVQLPCADGLVCRIDKLAAVAGRLGPNVSVLLGVEDPEPGADPRPGNTTVPDLLEAMALALLEDLGRPAARVAVRTVGDLCRPAPGSTRIDPVVAAQWEMPTPPLVSAP